MGSVWIKHKKRQWHNQRKNFERLGGQSELFMNPTGINKKQPLCDSIGRSPLEFWVGEINSIMNWVLGIS